MSGRFFITGLPRSRTAWFSVATTTPTSVCFHEPIAGLSSYDELVDLWSPKFGVDIGISDSCLALHTERILNDLSPRTLLIERPLEDVMRSYAAYASRTGITMIEQVSRQRAEDASSALGRIKDHPLVQVVKYGALDDYDVVLSSMRWLLPHREFPDLRSLMTFNIQVAAKHIQNLICMPHNGWHLKAVA